MRAIRTFKEHRNLFRCVVAGARAFVADKSRRNLIRNQTNRHITYDADRDDNVCVQVL